MKQVARTPQIDAWIGPDADLAEIAVYEAIALNTRPLRKLHPLYNGSVAGRDVLLQMAANLSQESLPVQIMHDKEELPIGRVFHGEVIDRAGESELRVLFFIGANETDHIAKIDAGTVDQVSVSIVPKQILNSVSGFDYLGPNATFENQYTGVDPDGNCLGVAGCYGKLVGLDHWFEMSLVGRGGAQNARIVSRNETAFGESYQRLAASGMDPNHLVLVATAKELPSMELTELVAQLTSTKADVLVKDGKIATLSTDLATSATALEAAQTQVTELTAKVAELEAKPDLQADLDAAMTALKGVAQKILTASGKVDAQVPETVAELEAVITETSAALAAKLVAGGRAIEAGSSELGKPSPSLGAFRISK